MTRRILITGGAGFIGSPLARMALAQDDSVCLYDLSPPKDPDLVPFWQKGDVRDAARLTAVAKEFAPDHFLHLASDIDVSITRLEQFTSTIQGTANALAVAAAIPGLKRFLHTSTQFVVRPGVQPRDEDYLEPYTVYGEAKAEAEKLVRAAKLPMPWVIVRPVIIWGPGHPSFADQIFRHIATRNYLHPVGRDPITRAFGYVDNVARQMLILGTLAELPDAQRVYYVGDGTIDYDEWADAFSNAITGRPARRIPKWLLTLLGAGGDFAKKLGLPAPIDSGRAFRMSTSSAIDLSSTLRVTGPVPVGFDEGVAATVAWLRSYRPALFEGR
jgi:nucleoside-diphosphate-sugar epimerase